MLDVKVGDVIYFEQYGRLIHKQVVERITPSGIIRTKYYNLRQDGSWLRITGQDRWASTYAYRATRELDDRWRQQVASNWLVKNHHRIKAEDIEPLMEKYPDETK